jgi:hypothetical protein
LLSTWTPSALSSEARTLRGKCWRLVEAQHFISTLKVVDSLSEQAILEEAVEEAKPLVPPECRHLHFLLSTPFRYKSMYPIGSRFRRAGRTAGVFYASENPRTAVAELAFHRLLFFARTPATEIPPNASEYTMFGVAFKTLRGLDLTTPPLSRDRITWTHPTEYIPCQALADTARKSEIDIIRYESVRDPDRGANVALLSCGAFGSRAPQSPQTWRLRVSSLGVQALCESPRMRLEFPRAAFAADSRIARSSTEE